MKEKKKLESAVKCIQSIYNPKKIQLRKVQTKDGLDWEEIVVVDVFMSDISDNYITNPYAVDIERQKEKNLELQIRNDLYNYLGLETSGLSLPQGWAPYKEHELEIRVDSGVRS